MTSLWLALHTVNRYDSQQVNMTDLSALWQFSTAISPSRWLVALAAGLSQYSGANEQRAHRCDCGPNINSTLLWPVSNRSCLETTVRMSSTVSTAAATISPSTRGTSQMPVCTLIRGTTISLTQSSTAARSTTSGTKTTTTMWVKDQMEEAQQAAGCLVLGALALRGGALPQTGGRTLMKDTHPCKESSMMPHTFF